MENKDRIKDKYGNEVPSDISFDEYWAREDRITDMSYKESVRQKEERSSRGFDKWLDKSVCDNHTEQKLKDGECCQNGKLCTD